VSSLGKQLAVFELFVEKYWNSDNININENPILNVMLVEKSGSGKFCSKNSSNVLISGKFSLVLEMSKSAINALSKFYCFSFHKVSHKTDKM
jgi:hypothetical protein